MPWSDNEPLVAWTFPEIQSIVTDLLLRYLARRSVFLCHSESLTCKDMPCGGQIGDQSYR